MYSETFSSQWQNLCCDFAQEYDRLTSKGGAPGCFAGWYETRLHRWQSVAYPEGIILRQTGSEELRQELTEAMRQFAFVPEVPRPTRSMWSAFVVGLAAAAASSAVLWLFHWNTLRILISAAVVFVVGVVSMSRSVGAQREQEAARVRDAYVGQLRDYLPALDAICRKYQQEEQETENQPSGMPEPDAGTAAEPVSSDEPGGEEA